MGTSQVRVRFVPRRGVPRVVAKEIAERVIPELASPLAIPQFFVGPLASLSMRIEAEEYQKVFKSELIERKVSGGYFTHEVQEVLLPDELPVVPESLRDVFEGAYVPTPPTYLSNPIPPAETVHHLRLDDVARMLNAPRCHRKGWTGQGVRVAMIDSGFAKHPYFDLMGYAVQRLYVPGTIDPDVDPYGHGTGMCANMLAVAPDCHLIAVKGQLALSDPGSADSLEAALAQSPRVLTCSWGFDDDHRSWDALQSANPNQYLQLRDIERLIDDAVAAGVVVVFAAGNGQKAFPACMKSVIAVGGVSVDAPGGLSASSYASSFRSQLYPGRAVPDVCGVVGEDGDAPMKGHIMLPAPASSNFDGANMSQRGRGRGGAYSAAHQPQRRKSPE